MRTIKLKVENDYNNNFSHEIYKDNLIILLDGLDVVVENDNNKFTNILEELNNNKDWEDYKYHSSVGCVGYSQGDWDCYTIHHNYKDHSEEKKIILEALKELIKLFTHKNDYIVEQVEFLESGHSKVIDVFSISITDVEFPENKDIKYYIDMNDIQYDQIEYNNN